MVDKPTLWCPECGSKRRVAWVDDRQDDAPTVALKFLCKDCGNTWGYELFDDDQVD